MLAVGMIPAAAFAEDEAVEVEADAAIELQAEEAPIELEAAVDTFNNGTVVEVEVDGVTYNKAQIEAGLEIDATGSAIKPEIKKVEMLGGQVVAIDTTNYTYAYYDDTDKDGKFDVAKDLVNASPTTAGTYFVTITGKSTAKTVNDATGETLKNATITLKYTIKAKSLEGAKAFNNADGKSDVSKTAFTYNGAEQKNNIGISLDGEALTITNDYTVEKILPKGGTAAVTSITDANTYYLTLAGAGKYAGSTATVEVTVDKLDLSKTDWFLDDVSSTAPTIASVNTNTDEMANGGSAPAALTSDLQAMLDFAITGYPTSVEAFDANGEYTATVTPKKNDADAEKNIVGSKEIKFSKGTAGQIHYKDQAGAEKRLNGETVTVTKSSTTKNDTKDFDIDSIALTTNGTALADDVEIEGATFTYEVKDAEGAVVASDKASAAAKIKEYGTWTLKVVGTSADKSTIATATVTIVVQDDSVVAANNLFIQYKAGTQTVKTLANGAGGNTLTYNGTDLLKDLTVTVKDSKGATVPAADYKVKVTKAGKEVTEIKDQGTYRIEVTSDKIALTGGDNYATLTVGALALVGNDPSEASNNLRIAGTDGDYDGTNPPVYMVRYTGAAITPSFEFAYTDDKGTTAPNDDSAVWAALPTGAYKIAGITFGTAATAVTEINKAGTYTVTLAPGSDATAAGNFTFSNAVVKILVSESSFIDVPGTSWSAEYVNDINENGWMTGYSDGKHFGPKDNMKRGDVCLVLYRMATGTDGKNVPNAPENTFTDVKEGSYWEDAIAWAADAGIVTGYSGKDAGKFGPSDNVTREQFMLMMARYAKYQNVDTKSDGKAMATKKDPQKVSSWAKDAVAWGVDGDMIGSNGTIDPQGKITREQIAKIVMVFADANKGVATPVAYAISLDKDSLDPASVKVGNADVKTAAAGENVTITCKGAAATKTATIVVKGADGYTVATDSKASGTAAAVSFKMPVGGVTVKITEA